MPGAASQTPTVSLSFANNFWGKDDAGVGPMLERVHNAKITCDELRAFYSTRAAIEDEYSRKLIALCRKPLGSNESGSLRSSLDTVRGETEVIGKTHAAIASQMKCELEEPLAAFAGGMKERRKLVQNGIERLLKAKVQQAQTVNKSRDRYEQDCLRIKGYLAQGHMVMGQEERKNKAKLEKTQIQLASNSTEYEGAVKILEETTGRWNKEWKAACDKFQDLEEERLDFTKSSLWNYANITSAGCVSDDASCEKIRISLESCDVEKDISSFIREKGTGQEIPDPPKYINFCRGDLNDTSSETSEEESYSVAQFLRSINPAYRTSSPQPSTYESHHDPQSELAIRMGRNGASTPSSREATVTAQKPSQQPAQQDFRPGNHVPPNYQPSQHGKIPIIPHNEYPTDGMTMFCRTGPPSERSSAVSANRPSSSDSRSECSNPTSFSSQEPSSGKQSPTKPVNGVSMSGVVDGKQVQKKRSVFFSNSPFRRKSKQEKERPQPAAISPVAARSAWANPRQSSPVKTGREKKVPFGNDRNSGSPEPVDPRANFQLNVGNNVFDVALPDDSTQGAFKANDDEVGLDPIAQALADLKLAGKQSTMRVSADRYHGIMTPAPPAAPSGQLANSSVVAAQRGTPPPAYHDGAIKRLNAPQPAFTSAQMQKTTHKYAGQTQNLFNSPTRQNLRGSIGGETVPRAVSPAPRQSTSPRPESRRDLPQTQYKAGESPNQTPYQGRSASPQPSSVVDPPLTQHKNGSGQNLTSSQRRSVSPNAASRGDSPRIQYRNKSDPKSTPDKRRCASPQPTGCVEPSDTQYKNRSGPGHILSQPSSVNDRYNRLLSSSPTKRISDQTYTPQQYSRYGSPNGVQRAVSPHPPFRRLGSPSSGAGMELQLSSSQVDPYGRGHITGYGGSHGGRGGQDEMRRPMSMYYGAAPDAGSGGQVSRMRSKSIGPVDGSRQYSRDGRPILHFARAMYSYTAVIPEEMSFTKGDILAILRHQDDGWWEAELTSQRTRPGLVPSNYLQRS